MKRSPVRRVQDAKYFRQTANTTKTINVGTRIYRGGVRL